MHQTDSALLADFLTYTLAGTHPSQSKGLLTSNVHWQWHAPGALQFWHTGCTERSVLISAGIHGNETAPLEICNQLIQSIAAGTLTPKVNTLFLFGNIPAMQQNKRYVNDDLNRLFSGKHQLIQPNTESARAHEIEQLCQDFFAHEHHSAVHLDLHTAIRGSKFERFAIAPFRPSPILDQTQYQWLQHAQIEAILLNEKPAGTFSYYTSHHFGASALTLELGKAKPFGQNELDKFAAIKEALITLITDQPIMTNKPPLKVFQVVGELLRHTTEHFVLQVADDVENFTAFPEGTVIASDENYQYQVSHPEERIVFPNKTVKPGLRAGLMVVETTLDQHLAP